jgi:hypothetical protein
MGIDEFVSVSSREEDENVGASDDDSPLTDVLTLSPGSVAPLSTVFSFSAAFKRARRSLSRLLASHRATSNGEKKLGSPELERPNPRSHQHLSMRRTMPSIGGAVEVIVDDEMEDVTDKEGGEVREA